MRTATPSFIHELPLRTTPHDAAVLEVRLDAARNLYNACLQEALRRLDLMRESKAYQAARKLSKGKERTLAFAGCCETHGFYEYDLHAVAGTTAKGCWIGDHLDAFTIQKVASRAFDAVQMHAFGKRGRPRFKRKGWLASLEGKSNAAGIRWRDGRVLWSGLALQPVFDFKDRYGVEAHALGCRVKYLRLVQRTVAGEARWSVQLVLEGVPLQKEKNIISEGVSGPASVAGYGAEDAFLSQFCDEVIHPWRAITRDQRGLDRSRRATNPENYNPDGSVKKGTRKWHRSNRYQKLQARITETQRKLAATRKKQHGQLCNKVLALGTIVKLEKLSYKSLQKNFGRSVAVRAPGMFAGQLTRKAANAGGRVEEINTRKTKLSQTCICGAVKKKPLSQRHHVCECGVEAQRDLFSAYLAFHCHNDTLDIRQAEVAWPAAEPLLKRAMSRLSTQPANRRLLTASFGLSQGSRSQSCSPVADGSAVIEAVDVVADAGHLQQLREPRKDACLAVRTPWL